MRRSEVNSFFWNVLTIPVELNITSLIDGKEPTAQTMSQKSSRALDMSSFPLCSARLCLLFVDQIKLFCDKQLWPKISERRGAIFSIISKTRLILLSCNTANQLRMAYKCILNVTHTLNGEVSEFVVCKLCKLLQGEGQLCCIKIISLCCLL